MRIYTCNPTLTTISFTAGWSLTLRQSRFLARKIGKVLDIRDVEVEAISRLFNATISISDLHKDETVWLLPTDMTAVENVYKVFSELNHGQIGHVFVSNLNTGHALLIQFRASIDESVPLEKFRLLGQSLRFDKPEMRELIATRVEECLRFSDAIKTALAESDKNLY